MRIISIDGGGYLGLASAAFISGIEQHFGINFHDRFDLFCGTSTGAIIALSLAAGRTGSDVVRLYKEFGPAVFSRRTLRSRFVRFKGVVRARYPNDALRQALEREFGAVTLDEVWARRKAVLVTAFSVTTGHPRVFKTNHSANLTTDGDLKLSEIALASSAAPGFLPLVRITNPRTSTETFCDGGVVANHPALLGFAEALSELQAAPGEISILSISTPRTDLGEGVVPDGSMDRGVFGWWRTLPSIFIDSNSMMAHQLLGRVVSSYPSPSPQYKRVEMSNLQKLPIDRADELATETLMVLGANTAASNVVRRDVGRVLGIPEEISGGRSATI